MEVFKFILTNYGPAVAACCLMFYLCFFTKNAVQKDEKKLKDDLAMTLRENAELKVELKKAMAELNRKVEDLNIEVNHLVEESEDNVSNDSKS